MTSKTTTPVTPLMRMGCTKQTITYRSQGLETVCLQSPSHGEQKLVGFDPSKGDVLGLDDILETTTAATNLSDVAQYITAATTSAGTTLYFDSTGTGQQGSAIAFLQGVATTVAQLVADGGMAYIPDAYTAKEAAGQNFTFRPSGLETLTLSSIDPGHVPIISGFDPTNPTGKDILDLHNILNSTNANPNLSDIGQYVTATQSGGNTILSLDATGSGGVGTSFAVLQGDSLSVAQLVVDGAVIFSPSPTSAAVQGTTPFVFRPEGEETAVLASTVSKKGPAQLVNFNPESKDILDIHALLGKAGVQGANIGNIGDYVSATQTGANETLWLDPTGHGKQTTPFAVLDNSNFAISTLSAAFKLS